MSGRYVLQADCPRCKEPPELMICHACATPLAHCSRCGYGLAVVAGVPTGPALAGEPACPSCRSGDVHPAIFEDVTAHDLVTIARPVPQPPAPLPPAVAAAINRPFADDDDIRVKLALIYGTLVVFVLIFAGELGNDIRMPWWVLLGTALVLGWVGRPAWPGFVRDPWAIATALAAATSAWLLTKGAVWLGENGAESLTRAWRWWLEYALVAGFLSAYGREPALMPDWLRAFVMRWGDQEKR